MEAVLTFIGAVALIAVLSNRRERTGRLVDRAFDLADWTIDQIVQPDDNKGKGK